MQFKFLYQPEIWGKIWTITGIISGFKKKGFLVFNFSKE